MMATRPIYSRRAHCALIDPTVGGAKVPVGGALLLIFLMVGSHGAPDLNQEVGVLYCGHLVPLELLLRCLLLQLTFSRDCEGLDRLGLGLVDEQELLL